MPSCRKPMLILADLMMGATHTCWKQPGTSNSCCGPSSFATTTPWMPFPWWNRWRMRGRAQLMQWVGCFQLWPWMKDCTPWWTSCLYNYIYIIYKLYIIINYYIYDFIGNQLLILKVAPGVARPHLFSLPGKMKPGFCCRFLPTWPSSLPPATQRSLATGCGAFALKCAHASHDLHYTSD